MKRPAGSANPPPAGLDATLIQTRQHPMTKLSSETAADYKALQPHPLAKLFPKIKGDDLRTLAYDIQEHGLHKKITLYEGKILDGVNRHRGQGGRKNDGPATDRRAERHPHSHCFDDYKRPGESLLHAVKRFKRETKYDELIPCVTVRADPKRYPGSRCALSRGK
jgi:hypothetical protein